MKKILAAVCAAGALLLSGCSDRGYNAMATYDFAEMDTDFIQLKAPQEGDTIAVIDTEYGEIRAVIYDELCPDTAQAFINHANNGDYDNKPVYGVMQDCYFLTGGFENEKGVYTGRNSDDELVAAECTTALWPFKGALMAFSERGGYSDARWFMCNDDKESLTEDAINDLKQKAMEGDEDERDNLITLFDTFYSVRGVFGLAGVYTVFGQAYEGLDVIEQLCSIPSEDNFRAKEDVMINSVTISQYKAEE